MSIRVRVGGAPDWVQYVVGFGTVGAAIFAAVAAMMTRRAADASRNLVALERERETRAIQEQYTRHARRVVVDMGSQEIRTHDGRRGFDFYLAVINAGRDPVFRVRIKVQIGDSTWGPQLIGNLVPRQEAYLMARIYTDGDDALSDAHVRVTDIDDHAWVITARGVRSEDRAENVEVWIADGRAFAARDKSVEERGTLDGATRPDYDSWRAQFDATA